MPGVSAPNNTEPKGPKNLNMIEMAAPSLTSIICLPLQNLCSDWLKKVLPRDLPGACPRCPPHQNFCPVAQLFAALHYNNFSEPLSITFSSTRIDLSVVTYYYVECLVLRSGFRVSRESARRLRNSLPRSVIFYNV